MRCAWLLINISNVNMCWQPEMVPRGWQIPWFLKGREEAVKAASGWSVPVSTLRWCWQLQWQLCPQGPRTLTLLLCGDEGIPPNRLLPASPCPPLQPPWGPSTLPAPSKPLQRLVPVLLPFSAELVPQMTLQLHHSKISWILHLTLIINYPNGENWIVNWFTVDHSKR